MRNEFDVVVVGAGAAGVGAAWRLRRAGVSFLVVDARERVGGRAHTIAGPAPLDMGCEWLHSAQQNIFSAIGEAAGFGIARVPAPWERRAALPGFPRSEPAGFREAFAAFEARIEASADTGPPLPAAAFLEPGSMWNPRLNAVFCYISGAALSEIDARDYARYEDTGQNWRVREGYGALIAAALQGAPLQLNTMVQAIALERGPVRIETSRGPLHARTVIVTIPTSLLPNLRFTPDLPEKMEAAASLPLGAAEKVYFALADADEFPIDASFIGRFERADTASYHLRSLGRPLIEAYFGGALAHGLALEGPAAMADFARSELAELFGADFLQRLTPLAASSWAGDPYALGSYSYAKVGCADMRAVLAAPVEERLFFAGEACSRNFYSTAHGAFQTGYEAADQALASLGASVSPRA